MNDKNIEEKAKEYAKDCAICPTLESQDEIDRSHREEIERAYTHAYTQAVTYQSDILAQYKEALRESIDLFYEHEDGYIFQNVHEWQQKAHKLLNNE